jgi:hypothetical protein
MDGDHIMHPPRGDNGFRDEPSPQYRAWKRERVVKGASECLQKFFELLHLAY